MLIKILRFFKSYYNSNTLIACFGAFAAMLSLATYYTITAEEASFLGPDPSKALAMILVDLIVFLSFASLLIRKILKHIIKHRTGKRVPRLQNKIITVFTLVTAIPTIIVAIFSTYLFNFGIQAWFDKKITTVLDQSMIVAQSYINEHTLQLKETALSVASDLNEMYYDLIYNGPYFNQVLNAQSEMRSLDEAIVFQSHTSTILAQTSLSFSLSFVTISERDIASADRGEVVQIKSDLGKIRMLIKLKNYKGTYLLIGRLVDSKVLDHISQTKGATQEYNRLKNQMSSMQIQFSVVFVCFALLLIAAAISWGIIFANKLVQPISNLVDATEKVKKGDLSVQVPEEGLSKDEISDLSSAFNHMIQQINYQRRDLIVAQRALAWSDVARRVAHEIKNPLTPIQLATERLQMKFGSLVEDQDSFRKYTNTILRHSEDIKKIVGEFVNFARLPQPVFVEFELVSFIKDLVDSRKLINEHINYSFESNAPKIDFVADITQINQVIVNLLDNAQQSFENKIKNPIITVTVGKKDGSVFVTVEDNGSGFDKEIIAKPATPYLTTKSKGTGLGLAIVQKIVQDHFGRLELANAKSGGAVVRLIFNLEELKSKLK